MRKDILAAILVFIILILAALCFSCKEYTTNPKCDIPGSPSVIEKLIPNPKAADLLFTVANFEALEAGLYTKAQVEGFFADAEALALTPGVTLSDLALFAMEKIDRLKDAAGRRILLASIYLDLFQTEVQPISAMDQCLISLHIDNQRQKVLSLF